MPTIGQSPFIKSVWADTNGEILILFPLSVLSHADGKRQLSAFVLRRQLMPVIDVEIGIVTLCVQFTTFGALHHHIDAVDDIIGTIEIQRCNLCRYRHADIIRINPRQFINNYGILYLANTSYQS